MLSPPPRLCRSHATTYQDVRSAGTITLLATVKAAYANLPFKGEPLVLPGGVVAVEDMWQAALETKLDAVAEEGDEALRNFSLENWLVAKVEAEGTAAQKQQLKELRDNLDASEQPAPVDDELRSFYSTDLMSTHFQEQPLLEVEVYRDLNIAYEGVDEAEADEPTGPKDGLEDAADQPGY